VKNEVTFDVSCLVKFFVATVDDASVVQGKRYFVAVLFQLLEGFEPIRRKPDKTFVFEVGISIDLHGFTQLLNVFIVEHHKGSLFWLSVLGLFVYSVLWFNKLIK